MRVVSRGKALAAGAAGAFVWEAVLRSVALAGLPLYDIVRELGTLAFPSDNVVGWWTTGMAAHACVGAAWALFYAHFFWARVHWPAPLQGLTFAAFPAALATFLVVPQFALMHLSEQVATIDWRLLSAHLDAATVGGVLLGHALFGVTVGAIYTHPVGYSARSTPARRPAPPRGVSAPPRRPTAGFMFATGIECSYPTVEQGSWRRDLLDSAGHYRRWQEDFALARQIGITHIRYGPPLHLIFTRPGRYDWTWIDEQMRELEQFGPEPIIDLCHFGVPGWLENFQNEEIGPALAEYAGAFAQRFPWVRFYTPVNEMYVCARLSALEGLWNEQLREEGGFVSAIFNLADASVRMTDAILSVRGDAMFINSESSEFCQACCPDREVQRVADFENERRFLALDLIYAHEVSSTMRSYLREHCKEARLDRFMQREVPRRTVLGLDYYEWNERLIDESSQPRALGELFGWHLIASQYYERYRRPLMHTETNRVDAGEAPRWLWRQWHNVQLLRRSGVPLVGFTWYSLTDQVDWDSSISEPLGIVYPVGLFDLNRDPRSVGLSYKHLIDMHRDQPDFRNCRDLSELLR